MVRTWFGSLKSSSRNFSLHDSYPHRGFFKMLACIFGVANLGATGHEIKVLSLVWAVYARILLA
jgi:hypothetical protein